MKSYAATAAAAMSAIIVSTAVFGARFQPEYIDYGDYSSGSSLTRSSLSFLYEYVNGTLFARILESDFKAILPDDVIAQRILKKYIHI